MLLPDMSMNTQLFAQRLTISNNVQTVVNGRPVQTPTRTLDIVATVQMADPEKLRIDNVDFSLRYIEVHAPPDCAIKLNDTCVYRGLPYKCVDVYPNDDYQYSRSIFEEVK